MPRVIISQDRQAALEELLRVWNSNQPRSPGQVGSAIIGWSVGSYTQPPNTVAPYTDVEPIEFFGLSKEFVEHLREQDFPFRQS